MISSAGMPARLACSRMASGTRNLSVVYAWCPLKRDGDGDEVRRGLTDDRTWHPISSRRSPDANRAVEGSAAGWASGTVSYET
jgi:hypothetical protein